MEQRLLLLDKAFAAALPVEALPEVADAIWNQLAKIQSILPRLPANMENIKIKLGSLRDSSAPNRIPVQQQLLNEFLSILKQTSQSKAKPKTDAESQPNSNDGKSSSSQPRPFRSLEDITGSSITLAEQEAIASAFSSLLASFYGNPDVPQGYPPAVPARKHALPLEISDFLSSEIDHFQGRFSIQSDVDGTGARVFRCLPLADGLSCTPAISVSVPAGYPRNVYANCSVTFPSPFESDGFLRFACKIFETLIVQVTSRLTLTTILELWELALLRSSAQYKFGY